MNFEKILKEVRYQYSRSSGKGGQNVNKVETKVEIRFDILASLVLSEEVMELLLSNLAQYINKDGILHLTNQETRSQVQNRDRVTKKMKQLLQKALYVPKARRESKPSFAYHRKRLKAKRQQAEKKSNRTKVNLHKIDLFLSPIR